MDAVAQGTARERAQIFEAGSARRRPTMSAGIIEKDFWVCWTLRRLFEFLRFRPQLIFKGGTSLSKVYNAIERFSEDVDLSLSRRDLGFADDRDPEQPGISNKEVKRRLDALVSECQRVIRERLLPELRADFASLLGNEGWTVELDVDDSQTVLFTYPKSDMDYGLGTYIRPTIRLEMGARSDDWPASNYLVTPYAAEVFPNAFQTPSCEVYTLEAIRTFWEKATLLHAEYHRPAGSAPGERLARHLYDLFMLSKNPIGAGAFKELDLLERVVQHKQVFFRSSWAHYETARPGSLHLVPPRERIGALRKDYDSMQEMLFGPGPSFEDILQASKEVEERINGS